MKKFSLIIVNHNSFDYCYELISNLEKFDRKLFDIFIVNNCTKHKIDETNIDFDKNNIKKIFFTNKNKGFANGNNIALKYVLDFGYKYIFLINPDTLIEDPKFFSIIEKEIIKNDAGIIGPLIKYYPRKDIIYFAGGKINKYTGLTIMEHKGKMDLNQFTKSKEVDFITGCAIIIKKEVFEKIGLLPEEYFLYFEETDFNFKAKKAGFKIIFTPKTCLFHKVSSSVKYLSNQYLYYMVRNQKIFSKKILEKKYYFSFYLFYIFFWCLGYILLSLLKGNFRGIRFIIKGAFS